MNLTNNTKKLSSNETDLHRKKQEKEPRVLRLPRHQPYKAREAGEWQGGDQSEDIR